MDVLAISSCGHEMFEMCYSATVTRLPASCRPTRVAVRTTVVYERGTKVSSAIFAEAGARTRACEYQTSQRPSPSTGDIRSPLFGAFWTSPPGDSMVGQILDFGEVGFRNFLPFGHSRPIGRCRSRADCERGMGTAERFNSLPLAWALRRPGKQKAGLVTRLRLFNSFGLMTNLP